MKKILLPLLLSMIVTPALAYTPSSVPEGTKQVIVPFLNVPLSTKDHVNGLTFVYNLKTSSPKLKKIVCEIKKPNDPYYHGAYMFALSSDQPLISHFFEARQIVLTNQAVPETQFFGDSDDNVDVIHVDSEGYLQLTDSNYDKGTATASCTYQDE